MDKTSSQRYNRPPDQPVSPSAAGSRRESVPTIKNWSLVFTCPYTAPEAQIPSINGQVYGHASRADGSWIKTSSIESAKDGLVTTVSGSVYQLGDADPNYEAAFPNARERVFAS